VSDAIVCVPVSEPGIVAVGSVMRACGDCGTDVWIEQSGLELVTEKDLTIVCPPCAMARVQREGPPEFMPVTERQIAEAAAIFYHHGRRS
jgi:hypothetical protein